MRFLSVCSGIEAASVAWEPLGWKALAFSEIEAFPRAVLKHHYPDVPLYGDFTALRDEHWIAQADLLVGGCPCQAFSVAGLRNSLSDERGNLTLEFVRLANAIDDLRRDAGDEPAWILYENVPGIFSTGDNAFGSFLGGLVGSDGPIVPRGRGWTDSGVVAGPQRVAAWRVLDAQHFGLAQRRRRVFVLAREHPRGWACADALLPLIDSLQGHPAPRREAGQIAPTVPSRSTAGGGLGTDFDCDGGLISDVTAPLTTNTDPSANIVAFSIQERAVSENPDNGPDGVGVKADVAYTLEARTVPQAVAFALRGRMDGAQPEVNDDGDSVGALRAASGGSSRDYVAFDTTQVTSAANRSNPQPGGPRHPLAAGAHAPAIAGLGHNGGPPLTSAVRRLTPRECARLQGFPDDYLTQVPWRGQPTPPDGPMYKALGNSMAVSCMAYIGQQIAAQAAGEGA